jgi:DNA polymerase-3 subunit delta'
MAPEGDIEKYLKSNYSVSDSQARTAAAFSGGIVKKAADFISDDALKKTRSDTIEISMNILSRDRLYGLSKVEYFTDNKDKIDNILDIMTSWYRDMVVYKECENTRYLINPDRADDIAHESRIYTMCRLNNIIDIIKNASLNIKSNVNYQLVIENMLLNIQEG